MSGHSHSHSHTHQLNASNLNRAFIAGIILNIAFVLVEALVGFYANSLSLLSDAGHNLSDVASLALSLFALKISQRKATQTFTYGFSKSTILASLLNAVILLVAVGSIGWEALLRFRNPEPLQGGIMAWVAGIGIVINAVSALFFFKNKEHELNAKSAYLHLITDALVSAGVVVAGVIIYFTNIYWIDPLMSLIIMAVVLASTWGLLRDSLQLSMDAVPKNVDMEKVKSAILAHEEVVCLTHIHIWAISTTKNAMTAHLTLQNTLLPKDITHLKKELKHELEHMNVQHATFETEQENNL